MTAAEFGITEGWVKKILRVTGHEILLKRLKKNLDESVRWEECSPSEQRILNLVGSLRRKASLTLLDQPLAGVQGKVDRKLVLKMILKRCEENETVVMSLRKPVGLSKFDRIVLMRKRGKIAFNGSFPEWLEWKANQEIVN
jgi:ABC-type multidrug transport system ATPase subunit